MERHKAPKPQDLVSMEVAAQIRKDLETILRTDAGRRVFMFIMEDTGTFKNAFTGNGWTQWYLGKQAVGQWLFGALLDIDPGFLGDLRASWTSMIDGIKNKLEARRNNNGRGNAGRTGNP